VHCQGSGDISKIFGFPAGTNQGSLVVLNSNDPLGDEWLLSNRHEVVKVVGLTLTASVSEHITAFITFSLKGFK